MAARKTAAQKRVDEVKNVQKDAFLENVTNVPGDAGPEEAIGTTPTGKKNKVLGFTPLASEVVVTLDGKEIARFDANEFRSVQRAVSAAGAAV